MLLVFCLVVAPGLGLYALRSPKLGKKAWLVLLILSSPLLLYVLLMLLLLGDCCRC